MLSDPVLRPIDHASVPLEPSEAKPTPNLAFYLTNFAGERDPAMLNPNHAPRQPPTVDPANSALTWAWIGHMVMTKRAFGSCHRGALVRTHASDCAAASRRTPSNPRDRIVLAIHHPVPIS